MTTHYFVDNNRPGPVYVGSPSEVAMALRGFREEGGNPTVVPEETVSEWLRDPSTSPVPTETWKLRTIPAHWLRAEADVALVDHPHLVDLIERAELVLSKRFDEHNLTATLTATDAGDDGRYVLPEGDGGDDTPVLRIEAAATTLELFPRRTVEHRILWVLKSTDDECPLGTGTLPAMLALALGQVLSTTSRYGFECIFGEPL